MTEIIDVPGNSAGTMNGDGSRKALLHSTEGSTWQGAVGAYTANNSWPHRTVDAPRRIVVRHLPLGVPARALRNEAGGVETNREGTVLIQYELVGFASIRGLGWSDEDWAWFGREVLGPDCKAMGVPLRSPIAWITYPDSYGKGAVQRMSFEAWDAYDGICGHQHAPENTHGDPGAIPIAIALEAATGPVEEDDLPYTPDEFQKNVREAFLDALTPGHPVSHRVIEIVRNVVNEEARLGKLVKGDENAKWWAMTPISRRHIPDRGHAKFLVGLGLLEADGADGNGDPVPFVKPQAEVDKVPAVT